MSSSSSSLYLLFGFSIFLPPSYSNVTFSGKHFQATCFKMQFPSTKILIYLLALFSCICISGLCNILYVISFSAFLFSNVSFMKAGSLVCFSPCYSVRLEQHPTKVLDKPLVGRFDTAPGAQSVSVTAASEAGPSRGFFQTALLQQHGLWGSHMDLKKSLLPLGRRSRVSSGTISLHPTTCKLPILQPTMNLSVSLWSS